MTRFLALLTSAVALVLLIACSNVAGLLLARGVKREREIGIRLSLGAGRGRLAQQLLTEGLLLSLSGGAAGLAVAFGTSRFLSGFHVFGLQVFDALIDLRMLAVAFALSVLTGIAFGLAPLRQVFRFRVTPAPKWASASHSRSRNLLIVSQVALSLILLTAAGLFVRTLRNAQAADPTREPERVLLLNIDLGARNYDPERGQRFHADLLERLHGLPGVRNAAFVMVVPFGGRRGGTDIIPHPGDPPLQVDFNRVSTEYFQTVGLPIVRGRAFDARDREGAPAVVIVNEQMASRFWPGEDPIGKQIQIFRPKRSAEVVGVVRDGRFRGYRSEINPCYYEPLLQHYIPVVNLEIRTAGDALQLVSPVLREIQRLDKGLVVAEARTLRSFRDAGLGKERLSAALLSGLGILAALIAAIGLYGVLAFAVAQRTPEIGIRMALGAGSRQVLLGVLRDALVLVGAGIVAGLVAARMLTRLVSSLLYGISPTNLVTYAAASGILIAVGVLAALIPAHRAARIDPMEALRYE